MTIPLPEKIRSCRICDARFRATATGHAPNPVAWFGPGAQILIASQAPGIRVHYAETPFWDRSGVRLRDWLGMSEAEFYDRGRVAILPNALCFPGHDAKGGDLPPPTVCAATWHEAALDYIGPVDLRLVVGGYAQKYHLNTRTGVTETVRNWRDWAPGTFPLPHPSWRNNAWLKANPWFEAELLPELREAVRTALG